MGNVLGRDWSCVKLPEGAQRFIRVPPPPPKSHQDGREAEVARRASIRLPIFHRGAHELMGNASKKKNMLAS
jgi:hypothetical protein